LESWPADHVERLPVSKLVPNARNARTHSDEQVAQLAASIKEWGWTIPILVDEAGGIIAGHGRVMAASRLGAPPADLLPLAKGLWQEVANQIPHGVATKSDRVTFEILIRMLAQVRETPAALTPALASQIRVCAGAFGMSPADRAKLAAPPPEGLDPAAKYFDR
jgi:hypothetical protein